ncbi:MAG: hypothetical protein QNK37_07760 [Acidobacteriota bacterium]|nr:hypothetical protein [Acidobacteriota bacterium]
MHSVSFLFEALGKSWNFGPYDVFMPFERLGDIKKVYMENWDRGRLRNQFLELMEDAARSTFSWIQDHVTSNYEKAAGMFKEANARVNKIAEQLEDVYNVTPEQAATAATNSPQEAAGILKNTFDYSVGQVGEYLADTGEFSESEIGDVLRGIGFSSGSVGNWLRDSFPYL